MKKQESPKLHPRNIHQGRYDLEALSEKLPELKEFVFINPYGNQSLDFSNPRAVKTLNAALLKAHYQVEYWDIPSGFLCPPIPGRADYIHYLADLLGHSHGGKIPSGPGVRVLDVGTGANLIYPILGSSIYGWSFVGSESNPKATQAALQILEKNPALRLKVELRRQPDSSAIFSKIIQSGEFFDLTLCNPPFHESAEAAQEGSRRKVKNLSGKYVDKAALNFGGQAAELWTPGGELSFIRKMIEESRQFKDQVFWFTSLVSKAENLKPIQKHLLHLEVSSHQIVEMAQGNKKSRFVAWTYLIR